jgi:hypothetical protein
MIILAVEAVGVARPLGSGTALSSPSCSSSTTTCALLLMKLPLLLPLVLPRTRPAPSPRASAEDVAGRDMKLRLSNYKSKQRGC